MEAGSLRGETGTGGLKVRENWECLEQVNDASVGKPGMCPEEEPSDADLARRNDLGWMTRRTVWPWRKSLEGGSKPGVA